ncbi:Oidioi.mRNA.OKI2018_I69.XSR.g15953.t1.cds [Oikopleura dioica]|uniref:Oidioi.mRNA.OKI2018_I69.XSR.g15953.t1.cds n=1 Tax=Oikopleura dioica TaxID=34765 RepID=A0ABN7SNU0_OIKDI|nr:Oidioi.mRNA.OKI2018_I69.XSR.g15953.t1.cds [Oikopleura dioica]
MAVPNFKSAEDSNFRIAETADEENAPKDDGILYAEILSAELENMSLSRVISSEDDFFGGDNNNEENEEGMKEEKMKWILRRLAVNTDENQQRMENIWKYRDVALWEQFPTSSGTQHSMIENGKINGGRIQKADPRLEPIPQMIFTEQEKDYYYNFRKIVHNRPSFDDCFG